ncbi:MAG: sulfite exporter TauE/SafE family protein [Pseudomonadota bacterium]
MLQLTPTFFAFAVPAVLFAGISKGGFGSGAAFASAALLALILEPGDALGVMLPLLMLIDAATLGPFWKRWNPIDSKLLILGGLPGVALGALLYKLAEPDVFRVLIGAIALGFIVFQLARQYQLLRPSKRDLPDWLGLVAGVIAGFSSFVSHAGGPPAAAYMLAKGRDKTTYQATTVLVFWVINIAKFIPYVFLGLFTATSLTANLILAPVALIGTWIGVKAHYWVSERLFFAITYVALGITGVKLLWEGLT